MLCCAVVTMYASDLCSLVVKNRAFKPISRQHTRFIRLILPSFFVLLCRFSLCGYIKMIFPVLLRRDKEKIRYKIGYATTSVRIEIFEIITRMHFAALRILRPTNEVEEKKMSETKAGSQTIGCRVTSCRYNARGCDCQLSRIEVEPKCGCHTGEPCDESLCGSYKAK